MATVDFPLASPPLPQQAVTGQSAITYEAQQWRDLCSSLFPGVGICNLGAFAPQQAAVPGMTIRFNGGSAALPGVSAFDRYHVVDRRATFDVGLTGVINTNPPGARVHKIWLAAFDRETGGAKSGASILITEDTGTGAPAPTGTAGYFQIGTVSIGTGQASILNSHLTYFPSVATSNFLGWNALPLAGGIAAATNIVTSWAPGYSRNHNALRLRGVVRPTAGQFASGSQPVIGTLPLGYRPTVYSYGLAPTSWDGSVHARVVIAADGSITLTVPTGSTPGWVSLDGVTVALT